jgi:hypothetical protein
VLNGRSFEFQKKSSMVMSIRVITRQNEYVCVVALSAKAPSIRFGVSLDVAVTHRAIGEDRPQQN